MEITPTNPYADYRPARVDSPGGGAPAAVIATAGVLMVLSGVMHVIQGIVALANDTFFVYGGDYVFKFDTTAWGWVHLLAGIIIAVAGVALFRASMWARVLAVVLACISVIMSFVWMPFYPLWSVIVIVFDVFVIWAVTAHGRAILVE